MRAGFQTPLQSANILYSYRDRRAWTEGARTFPHTRGGHWARHASSTGDEAGSLPLWCPFVARAQYHAGVIQVQVRVQRVGPVEVPLPSYQTPGSAGLDLCAARPEPVRLEPGQRRLIPAGLRIEIPPGYEGQVRPRSGLALRHGITVLNSPGTIDSDYRGELGIVLINHGAESVQIAPLDRIAQLVIAPVAAAQFELALSLSETGRAAGGYGSTGV